MKDTGNRDNHNTDDKTLMDQYQNKKEKIMRQDSGDLNKENRSTGSPENMLLDAMEGIDLTYLAVADAARGKADAYSKEGPAQKITSMEENRMTGANENTVSINAQRHRKHHFGSLIGKAAAAIIAVSILIPNVSPDAAYAMQHLPVIGAYFKLVTFRNYQYEDDHHSADVQVSGVTVDAGKTETSVQPEAAKSAEEINQKIQEKTDQLIVEFKDSLKQEGYGDLTVSTDAVTDNDHWYVLKLSSTVTQADSYEENRYYVIRKTDGKQVTLKDLFKNGADYQSVISQEIITEMKALMAKDENNRYFIDDPDIPDANFKEIKADQEFYINKDNQLVIVFKQGEVAPMYMGAQEFTIPAETIHDILAAEL